MTKLAIFDLDGTLLNTLDDLAGACNHALKECGCPVRPIEEYRMLVGRGITNLFRGALPEGRRSEEMVEKMRSHFLPYYNEHKCDLTRPYDGIIELLNELKEAGIALAVASNKYQAGTEKLVARYFADYDFVKVLGQREGFPIKPDAAIVFEAMEGIPGISRDETVYCGDSNVDMQTGLNAGVRTIGVTWGFRSREELAAYFPWLLADSPSEISDALFQSGHRWLQKNNTLAETFRGQNLKEYL